MTSRAADEDREFIKTLEAFEIAAGDFSHYSHIRMAYTYLCDQDTKTTCDRIRRVLCGFLTHHGIEPAAKYHETITRAWTLAVRHFMDNTPNTNSAAEFIEANPRLLDSEIILSHYSRDVLFSDAARSSFVEPNLAPIPV